MAMNYRTIKTYLPCELCEGNGLLSNGRMFWEEGYESWECPQCQGYGKTIETVRKEFMNEPMETKRGRTKQNR